MTTWETSVRAKDFCTQLTQTGALLRVWGPGTLHCSPETESLRSWNVFFFFPIKTLQKTWEFQLNKFRLFLTADEQWKHFKEESPLKWTLLLASGNLILAPFQKWLHKQLEKNHIQLVGGDGVAEKANNTSARQQWYALCAFPDVRNHTTQRTVSSCTPSQTLLRGFR